MEEVAETCKERKYSSQSYLMHTWLKSMQKFF